MNGFKICAIENKKNSLENKEERKILFQKKTFYLQERCQKFIISIAFKFRINICCLMNCQFLLLSHSFLAIIQLIYFCVNFVYLFFVSQSTIMTLSIIL